MAKKVQSLAGDVGTEERERGRRGCRSRGRQMLIMTPTHGSESSQGISCECDGSECR